MEKKMKREELKELLRSAIYETGETKRTNKAKKKAAGFTSGDVDRGVDSALRTVSQGDPEQVGAAMVRGGAAQAQQQAMRGGHGTNILAFRQQVPHPPTAIKADPWRGHPMMDPANRSNLQYQGVGDGPSDPTHPFGNDTRVQKDSPVPAQVRHAASREAGGKVVFGRYYDSRGQYLGRSQGGQWVDGKTDPNAQSQMEMYNKIQELLGKGYTNRDKVHVKEMIREIVKSCG
jgi:hypothetical protein